MIKKTINISEYFRDECPPGVLHVSYGRTEFGARDIAVSCVDDNGNAFDISSYSARILGKKIKIAAVCAGSGGSFRVAGGSYKTYLRVQKL